MKRILLISIFFFAFNNNIVQAAAASASPNTAKRTIAVSTLEQFLQDKVNLWNIFITSYSKPTMAGVIRVTTEASIKSFEEILGKEKAEVIKKNALALPKFEKIIIGLPQPDSVKLFALIRVAENTLSKDYINAFVIGALEELYDKLDDDAKKFLNEKLVYAHQLNIANKEKYRHIMEHVIKA